MMPYLHKFQGNAPLVPYITNEVSVLLETLMQKLIKQSKLQAANSPAKIAKLKVLEPGIHLATADINVGFAATATLTKGEETNLQMYELKKECCTMLAIIVTKIKGRSPLKNSFSRKLASLDSKMIFAEPDTAAKMLKQVLTKLVYPKWRTTEQADGISTQEICV